MSARTVGLSLFVLLLSAWAPAQENFLQRFLQGGFRPSPADSQGEATVEDLLRAHAPQAAPSVGEPATEEREPPPATPPATEEALPGPGEQVLVPLSSVGVPGEVQFEQKGGRISLVVRDASLSYVLALLAERQGLNIVAANGIDALVSITLYNKTVEEALTAILSVANYTWTTHNGIIYVTSLSQAASLPPAMQGRQIEVFPLDYVSAQDLLLTVQSFLSPVGQAFVSTSDPQDNRRTQETLVVEDVPYALERIAGFVQQMDRPPRQVLIEAHILQVDLNDRRNHGVDFEHLFSAMGNDVKLLSVVGNNLVPSQVGIGSTLPNSFFATVSGGNLTAIVELLKTTTDAKTLASPRLLVINEQQARLHVGEQIGYRQTTTTETSANEGAAFVEVGVILDITPRITRDNRIILHVRPEVSDGQINPSTQVPDTQMAELETNVVLDDGYGVVIGGLIKETDSVIQNKIPYLGDMYLIGKLFQSQKIVKERSEIIVVLIPRIFPYACDYEAYEQGNVVRTETELFEGPLLRKDRPWAPKLPDAITNPRIMRLPPVGKVYPYPATRVEYAGTPQFQQQFPMPRRPGPAVRYAPVDELVPHGGDGGFSLSPDPPILFDASGAVISDQVSPESATKIPPRAPAPSREP